MTLAADLLAFTAAAALLTVTPGLDTALVLRTAASEGAGRAFLAACGIVAGCLGWGLAVAAGLGLLLEASQIAYAALRWAGVAYLLYLGFHLLRAPRRRFGLAATAAAQDAGSRWLVRGFLTNMLNPKVGIFYVSFLPQFIPAGVNVPAVTVVLTAVHAVLGLGWLSLLIVATRPVAALLRTPAIVGWLDRVTGGLFVVLGLKLALSDRR